MESGSRYEVLMMKYFSGECTKSQIMELTGWVCASRENYLEYMRARNLWEVEHPAFEAESIDVEKAKAKLMVSVRGMYNKPVVRRGVLFWWRQTAAVLLLPLLILTSVLIYDRLYEEQSAVVWNECTAQYGTRTSVSLPDGTRVWINSGSTLEYPSVFGEDVRKVKLCGEGFFKVEADTEHPFVVELGDMQVVATGTEFNVEAYKDRARRVTLVEGKVNVNAAGTQYRLLPGYHFLRDVDGDVCSYKTDLFKWISWKDGVIAFRGDRLSYVFDRLSDLFNVKINIADREVADIEIRATFRGENLAEIMKLIEKSAPISVKFSEVYDGDGYFAKEYTVFSR